jgi:hypothetical protein
MKRAVVASILALLLFIAAPIVPIRAVAPTADTIYFDDLRPDLLALGNSFYEVRFRKSNGSIITIMDKRNAGNVTLGSRWECLWGASFEGDSPDYVGGCHYSAAGPARFSYAWQPATHTLSLFFDPDPAAPRRVRAQVQVRASDQPWLDMRLSVLNQWGLVLDRALFPSDLVFSESAIKEAILPILPGVSLDPSFFEQDRTYVVKYPGWPGVFADLVYVRTTGGELAIYALPEPPARVRPTFLGFIHDEAYVPDSTMYHHTFGVRLANGGAWESPWMRILVGAGSLSAAQAYREHTGLDRFPSLREKLGPRYDRASRSPLYKADTAQLGRRFAEYGPLLDAIPVPGILHPVAFQPGGHDENYPDFLPPDARWGTTADMAAMFRAAQARGFLVMPYTNPTWWDDESPTLAPILPDIAPSVTITDVAAINAHGRPITETYGANPIHFGYVVSPQAPFVKDRLDHLNHEMTADVPSDLLFEDQIGARAWLYDYNRFAPDHLAYMDGWLAHTEAYSRTRLMTEMGYDRLAATEVGFHGSVLLPEMTESLPRWRPVPWATLMLRDKVLFYQHDLAPQTFTHNKAVLGWNLALGYMLSYDLVRDETGGGTADDWLTVIGAFQQRVLARYADALVIGFSYIRAGGEDGPLATLTDFGACWTLVNWDAAQPFPHGEHTLPGRGAMVGCQPGAGVEGGLVAGVFTCYRGAELSPGDHYLIEERGRTGTAVRQLKGDDTSLVVAHPLGVPTDKAVYAEARAQDGRLLSLVPTTSVPKGLLFEYRKLVSGEPVDHYWLPTWPQIYLPLILRR